MKVKDALIGLCFLGSAVLTIFGGWNYMKGRINQYEETVKVEKLALQGYDAEEALQKIRKEKTYSLIMFATGVTGLFLIITNASRRSARPARRSQLITSTRQTINENKS